VPGACRGHIIVGAAGGKQVIEFIDDDAAARTFELVSWYLVFRVRNAHDVHNSAHPTFAERPYAAAVLQAYINSLYEYVPTRRTSSTRRNCHEAQWSMARRTPST
jgi:hypothetical protein